MTARGGPTLPGHLLVAGATGVLRPAAVALLRRGHRVSALARRRAPLRVLAREAPGRLLPLAADHGDPGLPALLDAAERDAGPFTGALLYCPTAPDRAVREMLARVGRGGVGVQVLTSRWAAPVDAGHGPWSWSDLPPSARPAPHTRLLLLGWRASADGGSGWHSPEEISAAALRLYDRPHPSDAVLGTVRPWDHRPA